MSTAREFDLAGKIFVVIGAGRGIGRGIVEVLADAGCDGIAVARTPTHLEPAMQAVTEATGRRVLAIAADATDAVAMDRAFEQAIETFGRIDIWINAAGDDMHAPLVPLPQADGSVRPAERLSEADFRKIFDLNFLSVHSGCRAVGGYFVKERRGAVINIGSVLGRFAGKEVSTYVAAKAGVEGLTRSLALEWGSYGVTVNCIAPGSFPDPDFLDPRAMAERAARAKEIVPLQRSGTLREIGLLTAFLASDAARYITGQTIYIDGGMALGRL